MSNDIITPTVGRKVWFRPCGSRFIDPNISTVSFAPHEMGGQPLDATIIYVWGDRCVNLDITDHSGMRFTATSVTLVQPGDAKPGVGAFAEWMPYQAAQAKKESENKPDGSDSVASCVLYPAIKRAMNILSQIPAGDSVVVDAAFNELHDAFWCETPAPAGAAPRREVKLATP